MNIEPEITMAPARKLVGMRIKMSLNENRTVDLWRAFMPRRHEIGNAVSPDLISLQIYSADYFYNFSPLTIFEKWAAVEVSDFCSIPGGMECFELPAGKYALFNYQGPGNDPSIYQYIFGKWLPASGFSLDHRPHFEVLGPKYKNNDPSSEEQIFIPVRE